MSIPNPNWTRWIFASVSKHFTDAAAIFKAKDGTTAPLPLYIEGNERDIQADSLEYFELRINGPFIREMSKDWWKVEIDINIIANAKFNSKDFHRIQYIIGQMAQAFTTNIEIYRFGDGIADDQSILTCLTLFNYTGEEINIQMLGQLQPDLKEQQASIDAYYQGIIET